MPVQELYLEDALSFIKQKKTRMVWLGTEPVEYIRGLLQLDEALMIAANPNEILHSDKEGAEKYVDHIFVCYHGVTSKYLAEMLEESHKVSTGSLRGGVTAIVGEIF